MLRNARRIAIRYSRDPMIALNTIVRYIARCIKLAPKIRQRYIFMRTAGKIERRRVAVTAKMATPVVAQPRKSEADLRRQQRETSIKNALWRHPYVTGR